MSEEPADKVQKGPAEQPASYVNHPAHYGGDTQYEAIKVIEAWCLGFNLGNTLKYIRRATDMNRIHSGKSIADLEKAVWYLQRQIEIAKGRAKGQV